MAFVQMIELRTKRYEELAKQMPLLEGAPTFFDLDVLEDRS